MRSTLYVLQRERDFAQSTNASYQHHLTYLNAAESRAEGDLKGSSVEIELELLDIKIRGFKEKVKAVKLARKIVSDRRTALTAKAMEARIISDRVNENLNSLQRQCTTLQDSIQALDEDHKVTLLSLNRYKQLNVMNDAFYVWFSGPFATINAFRLGNLTNKPVDFTEINAALGQASLALHIIATRSSIKLKHYVIAPMGSFPRILKADDRKTSYPLFIDQGSFSFFPKRNFNLALLGFMHCIEDISEHISVHDPTLTLPYKIALQDSKIGDMSFVYGNLDDEDWTRALKCMLANIKWIIAWYCKHQQ